MIGALKPLADLSEPRYVAAWLAHTAALRHWENYLAFELAKRKSPTHLRLARRLPNLDALTLTDAAGREQARMEWWDAGTDSARCGGGLPKVAYGANDVLWFLQPAPVFRRRKHGKTADERLELVARNAFYAADHCTAIGGDREGKAIVLMKSYTQKRDLDAIVECWEAAALL